MKIIFDRHDLAGGIALIHNATSSTATMPILGNLLIEAEGEDVFIRGTDLEFFGQIHLKAQVEQPGRITAPAKVLADIVKVLPAGEVTFVTEETRLIVESGRNTYQLSTMPSEDFPNWPRIEVNTTLVLNQADLKRALRNTMFAIPARDPRKILMGVLFDITDGKLICVATDGRRLGKTIIEPVEIKGIEKIQTVIPERILKEVDHALGDMDEVIVEISDRSLVFKIGKLTYLGNRIEGAYPKYDAVIPNDFHWEIPLQKNVIVDAIGRAAVLAERKYNSIVLDFKAQQIEVFSQSSEDGSYQGMIETDFEVEPIRIAFNYQYLQDILKIIPDSDLTMKIKENTAPVIFICESIPNSLFLAMPVKLADATAASEGTEDPEEV